MQRIPITMHRFKSEASKADCLGMPGFEVSPYQMFEASILSISRTTSTDSSRESF